MCWVLVADNRCCDAYLNSNNRPIVQKNKILDYCCFVELTFSVSSTTKSKQMDVLRMTQADF